MEKEEREGERSENVAKVICTELSFFQCFLFEPFVERLSRLIFGMMSMNYILYKTWEYFKPRTNALSRCATRDDEPSIDRLTRIRALRRSRMYREDFSGRGMIVTPRNPLLYPSDLHIRIAYGGERRRVSRIVLFLFREFVSNERMWNWEREVSSVPSTILQIEGNFRKEGRTLSRTFWLRKIASSNFINVRSFQNFELKTFFEHSYILWTGMKSDTR